MKAILFFLLLTVTLTAQKTSKGVVTRVVDCDTYLIDVVSYKGQAGSIRVRPTNCDCPEIEFRAKRKPAQEYGHEAKNKVASLIEGNEVELTYWGRDIHERVLAYVSIDGKRLDDIIISNGWGWADTQYQKGRGQYKHGQELEAKAREQKLGLWAFPNPIRPSEYRRL